MDVILGMFICLIAIFLIWVSPPLIKIVIIIFLVLCYLLGESPSKKKKKYKAGTLLLLGEKTASDMLDEIALEQVSMRLNLGESCFFEGVGTAYHSKDIVTGYKRNSNEYSIRPMKGLSLHSSSGTSTAVRKNVKTAYPGRLFITNERIVFLAERYGFDIDFNKLSNISVYNDYLEVFSGSKFYRVFSRDTVFIRDLIVLMNMCYEDQQIESDYGKKAVQSEIRTLNDTNLSNISISSNCENVSKPSADEIASTPSTSAINILWNYGSEADWHNGLAHYYDLLSPEAKALDNYMENVNEEEIKGYLPPNSMIFYMINISSGNIQRKIALPQQENH